MSADPAAPEALRFEGHAGVSLAADAWGDPGDPTLLFLHGGGQTRHSWRRSAARFADEGWYAVSLDARGHGESGWCPDGNYRLGTFVEDLRAVVASFDDRPAVVGASLGGLTALLAAGESPGLGCSALVMVDVAPRLEGEGTARIRAFMERHPDGFGSLDEAADVIAAYTSNRSRERNLAGLRVNLRECEDGRFRWHWDPAFLGAGGPGEVQDRARMDAAAGRLDVPTLLVRGRTSDVLSEEGAQAFLKLVPHAEYADVSGAGHMVVGDRNDAFTDAVAGFLRRRAASCNEESHP